MISVQRRKRFAGLTRGLIQRAARQVLQNEGVCSCEVSVLLTDDAEIHDLNRTWRNVDAPTDVLSFPLEEDLLALTPGAPLGDIVISVDTAQREASLRGASVDEVVAHLVVHGVLHLIGHDHAQRDEEQLMRTREQVALTRLHARPVMWGESEQ